jgi:hypothetical protein
VALFKGIDNFMIRTSIKYIWIFLFIQLLFSCHDSRGLKVANAFYYWKSTFNIDAEDANRWKSFGVTRLYTKYFDVVWNADEQSPKPISILSFENNMAKGIAVIPIVYLTNETFLEIQNNRIPQFAADVFRKIQSIHARINASNIPEIQVDCDRSLESRDRYFDFLYYRKAYEVTKDRELAAQCYCLSILSDMRIQNISQHQNGKYGLIMETHKNDYKKMVDDYSNTQYYDEVIKECSYLQDYVKNMHER